MFFKKIQCIIFVVIFLTNHWTDCAHIKKKKEDEILQRVQRAAVGPRWGQKVPFAFSNIIEFDFDDRAKIKSVLQQIQESLSIDGNLCIEFVERSVEKDYILFVDKGDCSSGVGFFPGINTISLAKRCLETGTIIHEVVHRLGFDHEHSRHDRDQNIIVLANNSVNSLSSNFDLNPLSTEQDAPYDYHSIIHYNSDALQKNNEPTIVSRIPVLISDSNEIHHVREKLTPIDVYKIQRFYKCPHIPIPEIVKESDSIEDEKMEKINERFRIEARFDNVDEDLIQAYLNKTYESCGIEHFWPPNYPLVESKHRLYKLMCQRKKQVKERCRYSIECLDEISTCVRPFFIKSGFCIRPENEKLNRISQVINDSMFKAGKSVKDAFRKVKAKLTGN